MVGQITNDPYPLEGREPGAAFCGLSLALESVLRASRGQGVTGTSLCAGVKPELQQPLRLPEARAPRFRRAQHLLGLVDEVVGLIPVCEEVCGLFVIHADVVISKQAREKVVNLSSDI